MPRAACPGVRHNPRAQAEVWRSPFQWGHPATPQCRLAPEFSSERSRARSGAPASTPASVHSLRSETAWFRADGRLWRFVARARPFARIAPGRRLAVATPAALPRSHRRRLLPPLMARRLHSTPAPARRTCSLDNLVRSSARLGSATLSRIAAGFYGRRSERRKVRDFLYILVLIN